VAGFEAVNGKVVRVRVGPGEEVLSRRGAMLGYTGQVAFRPVSTPGGMGGMVGRALSGESVPMMVSEGQGEVFFGYRGLHHVIIDLNGMEPLTVEADRLMVHHASLQTAVVPVSGGGAGGVGQPSGGGLLSRARGAVAGAMTGQGLFTTMVSGAGSVAVLAHGGAVALEVRPDKPVLVDPQAFVAARGAVQTNLHTDMGFASCAPASPSS
jgi:uncharacterized protein (AIM24 family)